jgi:hypothetical protein
MERRFLDLAPVLAVSAAGVEITAIWRMGIVGHIAREADTGAGVSQESKASV